MIKGLKVLFLLLLCFPLFAAANSNAPKDGNTVDRAKTSLREIDAEFENNLKRYLSLNLSGTEHKVSPSEKIKRGDLFFEKGDYSTAVGIFYSVAESVSDNDALKQVALYKLGESLFMQKNYVSATRYYEMVATLGNKDYKTKALKKLIFITSSLGEYAAAEKYYNRFAKGGNDISPDSELFYYLAKSLFFGGKSEEAVKLFSSIQKEAPFYPQARYFLGVMALRNKKFDEARAYNEEILALPDNDQYHNFKNIRELAHLAVARIAFELNEQEAASEHYVPISFDSNFFPQAYYELSWTFIKRNQFDDAIDTLRLLRNVVPHSRIATQAEILEGTLLVKMGRFGEATVLFDSIVTKYSKYQDELLSIDGKAFLASGRTGKISDFLLPYSPAVRSIFEESKKFSETVVLNNAIVELEEELKRIDELEKQIFVISDNKNAAVLFPPLKSAVKNVMSLRNRLAVIKNSLVMDKNGLVDESRRDEFEKLDSEKRELLEITNTVSVAPERIRECAEESGNKIINLEKKINTISTELENLSERLEALVIMHAEVKNLTEEDEKEVLDRINREREMFNVLTAEKKSYQIEIDNERNNLVLGGALIEAENSIRDSFSSIVARQNAIIGNPSEIAGLITEADRIDAKLADFMVRLNDAVKGIVANLRTSYEQEKRTIDEYKSELLRAKREVEEMAVLALYSNRNTALNVFADIVLQSDLGIIDVAWEKKEDASSEIIRLKTQKAKELQQLQLNLDGEQ